MAWKSSSYSPRPATGKAAEQIAKTIEKHRLAKNTVLEKAQKLSQARKEAINKIRDPELRKSAAR